MKDSLAFSIPQFLYKKMTFFALYSGAITHDGYKNDDNIYYYDLAKRLAS